MTNNSSATATSKTAFNRAAPLYDPDLWNSSISYEDFLNFRDNHKAILEKIYAVERNFSVREARDHLSFNPKGAINDSIALFNKMVESGLDNKQIASKFVLSEEEAASFRQPALDLYLNQGFQNHANCYSYAMNDPDRYRVSGDTPGGRDEGSPRYAELIKERIEIERAQDYEGFKKNLLKLVEADGAIIGGANAETIDGYYRVAVYALPPEKVDKNGENSWTNFHFLRENGDGTWSHKPGERAVTNLDKDGKVMTDPKIANIGGYEFISFVYVPEGGLDVGPAWEPASKKPSVQRPLDPSEDWKRNDADPFPERVEKIKLPSPEPE